MTQRRPKPLFMGVAGALTNTRMGFY